MTATYLATGGTCRTCLPLVGAWDVANVMLVKYPTMMKAKMAGLRRIYQSPTLINASLNPKHIAAVHYCHSLKKRLLPQLPTCSLRP